MKQSFVDFYFLQMLKTDVVKKIEIFLIDYATILMIMQDWNTVFQPTETEFKNHIFEVDVKLATSYCTAGSINIHLLMLTV